MKKLLGPIKPFAPLFILVIVAVIGNVYATLSLPNLLSQVIDVGIANQDNAYVLSTGLKMLALSVFAGACTMLNGFASSRISAGVGKNLRSQVFRKAETFSLTEFDHFGTSSLITRTTNDITQVQNFIMILTRMFFTAPIMALGGIFMAYSKSPQLSKVIFIAIPFLVILVISIARYAMPISQKMQEKLDRVNMVLREKLTGVRVIRAFNTEKYEEKRFTKANQDLTDTAIKMNRAMSYLMPTQMLILNIVTVLIVWTGAVQVSYGNIMVGDIMAVVQYVMQIMMSLTMVSLMFIMVPRALTSVNRIFEVLETQPVISDKPDCVQEGKERGSIEFRDVSFSYPNADTPALSHISFCAKKGEVTAIIGGTGSGKSTLVHLIPRFYDVTHGQVLVDGVDVRDYQQKALRAKIGFVPQKSNLFFGTIAENIRYGKENATEEEVEKAARIAQALDFISEKEEKFDSPIAQGGTNVSGGQKQRLSIARAIVRKPEIYIFDDSFSALDFKTDYALRKALREETGDATVLLIAQRVSTIVDADQIIVLNGGEVAGIGTHKELLENCDVYREIVYSQFSAEEVSR